MPSLKRVGLTLSSDHIYASKTHDFDPDNPASGSFSDHTYSAVHQENMINSDVKHAVLAVVDTFTDTPQEAVAKVATESIINDTSLNGTHKSVKLTKYLKKVVIGILKI